jgi:hypothetical protein
VKAGHSVPESPIRPKGHWRNRVQGANGKFDLNSFKARLLELGRVEPA